MGIDATPLEANAALRSIVRRDTGEDYTAFLTRLAEASGIATPTRAELARFDRSRKKQKTTSNAEWTHPQDPDARVMKMKDGRTHLAHKAEQAVDLETGAVVGVTVQGADTGDTTTLVETLMRRPCRSRRCCRTGRASRKWSPTRGTPATRRWWTSRPWDYAATSRSRTAVAGAGRVGGRPATPCMPTGAGFAGRGAVACCGAGGSCWSGRLRICLKPAGCGGCIFEGTRTS